ncbi:unnamed protein product [Effrenium voratum]|nr:unnamed protein product [Effrenium voratum]
MKGGGRYKEDIIPELERHLEEQLEQDFFDPEANLALLKLYLLHPQQTSVAIVEGILLKALMAYPDTHFSLCMFQIPEKYHADLKPVIQLSQKMEMAKFKSFWKESESVEALNRAKGWQEKVRDFIAGVVANMYRSIRVDQLLELLNLPEKDLNARVEKMGWSRSKEDKGIVVVNTATFESVSRTARIEPQGSNHMTLDRYKSLFYAASSADATSTVLEEGKGQNPWQYPESLHAFIGLGFEDRNDAFDFNCTLSDFKSTWIDRKEESAADMMPAKDLSLKEGQTIKINLPGKSRRREEKAEAGYGGGIGVLAPPPSGGSRRQGAAPAPAPAVSMAPAAAAPAAAPAVAAAPARQAPADDFFGDFNDFQGGGFAAPPLPAPATPPAAAPAPAPVPSPVRAELSLEGFGGAQLEGNGA